ncbi:MAG TPA: acyl-ACP--UDP-N-acetylglucosamine O-acyltransferase [Beijerinckiaceae bacterium]|nr:acyl-ACP--UDP-N-acetylglucosamine O-acyltransferase [Beijerinckiaceae bacterium]
MKSQRPAAFVHPFALVESGAELGMGVIIGPFCQVGRDVVLHDSVELISHAVVVGRTNVGARTRIFPFASIGHAPQDRKYAGEASILEIGADCVIREGVTINPGTAGGRMATNIGDRCTLLAQSHVAHDCRLGNDVVLANNVMLAGHVVVEDHAILGGGAAVQQFVRIGAHAFLGGLSGLESDIIPFGFASGNRARLTGLNLVGMRRRGFSRDSIEALRAAYRFLFAPGGTLRERASETLRNSPSREVRQLARFIIEGVDRNFCLPRDGLERPA